VLAGAGWVEVCGAGAGKISQIPLGADKKFQPAQDSSVYRCAYGS